MSWLNSVSNFIFDFIGPSSSETKDRKEKFPVVNTSALDTANAVSNALEVLAVYKNEHVTVAMGANVTLNLDSDSTPVEGDILAFKLENDGTARTATFGTGFKPSATVVGTINKSILITFRYMGSYYWETGRSAAI